MENAIILFGLLLLVSVFFGKISDRFGIPALLIFLLVGMLAGSEGLLGIHFDDQEVTQNLGTIALIFILFSGGIDTVLKQIKPVLVDGLILATLGVFLTTILVAVSIHLIYGYPWLGTLLVGAIISSTDAAAVFAILRSGGIKLKGKLSSLLELESGSNDPMAIFLTISIISIISAGTEVSISDWFINLISQFSIGIFLGYVFGMLLPVLMNKLRLGYWGLYPVLSIAWVLLLYGITTKIGGNGFIAVYVAGIFANTKDFVHKKNIVGFHDGIAWMMQVIIFVTLGLLVLPSQLPAIALQGFVLAFILMFVARPISVFICLAFSKYSVKEKFFISWVGLRGVVPVILATYPFASKIEYAQSLFNIVFFMVLASVLIQGMTLGKVAKFFGAVDDSVEVDTEHASPILHSNLKRFVVNSNSKAVGQTLVELDLPQDFLVLLVNRLGALVKPSGSFEFREKDLLVILCDDEALFKKVTAENFT